MKNFDNDVDSVDFKRNNSNKKVQEFIQKNEVSSNTLKVSLFDLAQAKKVTKKNRKTV